MLKIEGVGTVRFGPDGLSVILEYLPPYDERGQYGVDRGGRILQLGLNGKRQAMPLFEHQPDAKYWLGDASPDGRRLLVFQANRQQIRIGVYDFQTKRLTPIDEIPQVEERFEMNGPVWINDYEIILSARSKDWSQYGIRTRPFVADRTFMLRERAFAGEASGASVSTNPADHWYDGALIRYNVKTKNGSVIDRGRFGDFTLSADGKKLAALRLGQRLLHFPVDQLTDFFRFDTHLKVFDLENNTSRSFLPGKHVSMGSLRWSGLGSKLSFFAWDRTATLGEGTHYVMEPDSGSIIPIRIDSFTPSGINIARLSARNVPVSAEWLQQKLIIHGVLAAPRQQEGKQTSSTNVNLSDKAKWYAIDIDSMTAETVINSGSQPHKVHRLRDGRLLLETDQAFFVVSDSAAPGALDIANHDAIQILNGHWGDEIEDTIVFTASMEGNHKFGFLDMTQNEIVAPTTDVASRVLAWAPDTRHIIARADTEDGGTLYLQSPIKAALGIFTFNDHVSEIEHPRWETIEYSGTDGATTFSCVLLPYNYNPQKSYPTIVDVYPGTGKGCRNGTSALTRTLGAKSPLQNRNEVLSANSYLVVRPSNTYELNQSDGTVFGGLKVQVDAALNALVDEGMTDPERIGLWGFSNGSMASLWLASVSNRYKAVVPMFGASSPYIEYFGGSSSPAFQSYLGKPIVHLVQYESESGALPHSMGRSAIDDPIGYIKASPLDRAKNICAPVMMVQSDFDVFSTYHYEALFSALYRLGRRTDLVRYYGEGHGLRSPGNIRDFYKRVLAFFDRHVKSGAPSVPCHPRG